MFFPSSNSDNQLRHRVPASTVLTSRQFKQRDQHDPTFFRYLMGKKLVLVKSYSHVNEEEYTLHKLVKYTKHGAQTIEVIPGRPNETVTHVHMNDLFLVDRVLLTATDYITYALVPNSDGKFTNVFKGCKVHASKKYTTMSVTVGGFVREVPLLTISFGDEVELIIPEQTQINDMFISTITYPIAVTQTMLDRFTSTYFMYKKQTRIRT